MSQVSTTVSAVEAFRHGYQCVPIKTRSKRPVISAWPHLRWKDEDEVIEQFDKWAERDAKNIGVLLGEPSGGLIDIDLDHPLSLKLRDYFLPPTPMRTGRVGRPMSHHWFKVTDDSLPSTRQYKLPSGAVSVELRSTGSQTVIPPSIHPSGEAYRWEGRKWGGAKGPAEVDGKKLAVQVALLGLGAVLVENWPDEGSRHEAYLALAGGLLRYGKDGVHSWWEKNLPVLIRALAQVTNDSDGPDSREHEVMQTTIARLRAGESATGFPKLAEFIGNEHAEQARRLAREVESLAGWQAEEIKTDDLAEELIESEALVSSLPPEERDPLGERLGTWQPVDLEPYLAGEVTVPVPRVLRRSDGHGLFYEGRVNSLYGQSEAAKAQPLTSIVETPEGPRMVGDLRVGDLVFTSSMGVQSIEKIHPQGEREVWEVETATGVVVETDAEHLWFTRHRGKWGLVTTEHLAGEIERGRKHYLPQPAPVLYPPVELEVDPYLIGALLGDGSLSSREVVLSNEEPYIVERVRSVSDVPVTAMSGFGFRLSTERGAANHLLDHLDSLGMIGVKSREKRVPEEYLRGSIRQRLQLLHGLMDTDGTTNGRSAVFSTTSYGLAQDVCRVVRSLGGIARLTTSRAKLRGEDHGEAYKVHVRVPLGMAPFSLPRKLVRWQDGTVKREPTQRVRSVRRTGRKVPMQCITVSGDEHTYLTNGFTVTHNSWVALIACMQEMTVGERVMYLDFEDEPTFTLLRLHNLGVGDDDIRNLFTYVRPEDPHQDMQRNRWGNAEPTDLGRRNAELFQMALDAKDPSLIIVDGMTVLYGLHGLDSNDAVSTDIITTWLKRLCRNGRSTVIVIDHTGKGAGRGASPIGAHHKIAMVQGTALQVSPIDQPMPGVRGEVELIVFKDRPGVVRSVSSRSRPAVAAVVVLDSTEPNITRVEVNPPDPNEILIDGDEEDFAKAAERAERERKRKETELRRSALGVELLKMMEGYLEPYPRAYILDGFCELVTEADRDEVNLILDGFIEQGRIVMYGKVRWAKYALAELQVSDD